ncbi:MAG: murein biosynthesis integral membrane protein MurJ, partial [Verrucomicrobia bacterium]|nr:murein biosynthesis integral membrane protein MurJ [Verrucomicrobiota bacterium]
MLKENHSHISRYARHFFSGTLLSRISGMVRDISMAALFGDHPSVAAFMVAFRFSHFLRRLLGEGTLQSIFIPHYEELKLQEEKKANAFFFRLSILLTATLIVLILFVEGIAGFIFSEKNEVIRLFIWMFPSL